MSSDPLSAIQVGETGFYLGVASLSSSFPYEMTQHSAYPTGLAQEALLILAGHPSQLSSNPTLFHPSSIKSLDLLIKISSLYDRLSTFAKQIGQNINSEQPVSRIPHSLSIAAFGSSLSSELAAYQNLLVQLEFKLLSHHPSLVPADLNQLPSPPLTAILAEVAEWLPIFQALCKLIDQLEEQRPISATWSSPELISLIYPHSLIGSPRLAEIFSRLQSSVEQVWIDGFRSFVIYGQAPIEDLNPSPVRFKSSLLALNDLFYAHRPQSSALAQANHPLRFSFREHGLPQLPLLQPIEPLKESIQQICHALSILKLLIHPNGDSSARSSKHSHLHSATKIILPPDLQFQLRTALSSISSLSHHRFRIAIKNVQEILSNYLFSTYLTPEILSNALGTLTDVFFLRHSTFAGNLVDGMIRLKARRVGMVGGGEEPRMRRLASLTERELDVVLLKAGISTELGEDPAGRQVDLEGFSFGLLSANVGAQDPGRAAHGHESLVEQTFSQSILNRAQPVLLTYSPRPGLSLFLTKVVCDSYSKIHSCLFAFLIAQQRFKDSWRELTQKERLRSRFVVNPRGSVAGGGNVADFERMAFEGLRRMGWFINLMVDYFFRDVVDQSIQLLSKEINEHYQQSSCFSPQPGANDQPAEGGDGRTNGHGTSSNFFKIHASFLGLVETGLGLKNPKSSTIMNALLSCCSDFLLELESWSFELVPNLLSGLPTTQPVDDAEGYHEDGEEDRRGLAAIIRDREMRLAAAVNHFNSLLRQLIAELRKDDGHQLVPLSDVSSSSSSAYLGHDSNSSNAEFALKASVFRRACLDSLLLKFDFNLWFSSPP
ncbi:hypothetical protein PSHT_00224 [Puccinia striiformis]|uniref:Spindle pole body component n=1 Tax=Puccinia striiformis TaxID=27350 RepID=A0A2S4WNI9_9BASI|nr:hypothetical protein PSHT_00224 [Puccinia striiformis]